MKNEEKTWVLVALSDLPNRKSDSKFLVASYARKFEIKITSDDKRYRMKKKTPIKGRRAMITLDWDHFHLKVSLS